MTNFKIVSLATVLATVIAGAFGIVDNFHFVTGGVMDSWKQLDPTIASDDQRHALIYGGNKLWFVSRRGTSSHGGLISSYDIAKNSSWDHRSFKAADQSSSGDVLFAAGGRLFMLTIDTSQKRVQYRKLFVWDAEKYDWTEIVLAVDPEAVTKGSSDDMIFRISSADPDANAVYMISTVNWSPGAPAESVLSKLDIQFDDSSKKPIKANIRLLARKVQYRGPPPNFGFAAPVGKGDLVRLFVGMNTLTGQMSTYDSKTGQISNDTMSIGDMYDQHEPDDRMFQDETNLYMIRLQSLESESKRPNRQVVRLNLETLKSNNGPIRAFFPYMDPTIKFAFRPDQRLVYAGSVDKGVYVASVDEWFVQG